MTRVLHFFVRALLLLLNIVPVVVGFEGICLRETFFGQDINNDLFSPRIRGVLDTPPSNNELGELYLRDDVHRRNLVTVIPPGSGQVNLADMTSAASPDNGAAANTQVQSSTTSVAQTTESPQSTTATTASTSSSSSETTLSSSSPTPDAQSGQIVSGTYSQEPTGRQYTCNSDFVDFSKSDAMSKFSFVWCPENAYQTSNSVVWKLTGSCGTTMVYPWDFYYGRIEARIRIGSGSGVVTAMLLLGPAPSDEIDFEWVGKDTTHVQTMYYVQSHRVDNLPEVFGAAQNNGDLSTTFQDYAIELNKDSVKWYLNGILLRTLDKGAQEFPSDASRARMGIWDGTQTSGWAGTVDWSQGPFTAEMQWFNFTPYC